MEAVHRPWGFYRVISESPQHKVKEIAVHPNQRLSLQKHQHRAEHWVVVAGKALVQVGVAEQVLQPSEHVFIPAGVVHRLSNTTEEPLMLVEVQTGHYLGEDDIVRLADDYQRT